MQIEKLFERMEDLGMLKDGEGIFLPTNPKVGSIEGFPEGLDLENWELEKSIGVCGEKDDHSVVGVWAGGDWQEATFFTIFIYESKKPKIVPFDDLDCSASNSMDIKEFKKQYKEWYESKSEAVDKNTKYKKESNMKKDLKEEYTGPNQDLYQIDLQVSKALEDAGLHPEELASFRDEWNILKMSMEISGDWKHDHMACVHLMKEMGWEVFSKDEEDSSSDWYRCYYTFINKASATEEVGKRAVPGTLVAESKKKTSKKNLKEGAVKELMIELRDVVSRATEDDPMDHYAGYDTTQIRLESAIEDFAKEHGLTEDEVWEMYNEIDYQQQCEANEGWEEWAADPEAYIANHPEEFEDMKESIKKVKGLRESEIDDIVNKPFTELINDYLDDLVEAGLLDAHTKKLCIEDLRKGTEPDDLDIDLLYDGVGTDPRDESRAELHREVASMIEDSYMYADYWEGIDESDMIDDEDLPFGDDYEGDYPEEDDPLYGYGEEDEVRDMGEMYGVPRGATPEEALKHFESKKQTRKPLKEDSEEKYMTYKGKTCGWFKEDGVLFFNRDVDKNPNDWNSYDRRALPDLKKRWKADIDAALAKNESINKKRIKERGEPNRMDPADEAKKDEILSIVDKYNHSDVENAKDVADELISQGFDKWDWQDFIQSSKPYGFLTTEFEEAVWKIMRGVKSESVKKTSKPMNESSVGKNRITKLLEREGIPFTPRSQTVSCPIIDGPDVGWSSIEKAKAWFAKKGLDIGFATVDGLYYYGFSNLDDEDAQAKYDDYLEYKDEDDDDWSDFDTDLLICWY